MGTLKRKIKGFTLVLSIVEGVIVVTLSIAVLTLSVAISKVEIDTQRKYYCVSQNSSMAELATSILAAGADIEDIFDLEVKEGEYETKIVEAASFGEEGLALCKLKIDTSYSGDYYANTEITLYVNTQ